MGYLDRFEEALRPDPCKKWRPGERVIHEAEYLVLVKGEIVEGKIVRLKAGYGKRFPPPPDGVGRKGVEYMLKDPEMVLGVRRREDPLA